ncbi:hypothetical protein NUW54_g12982 [Trametes sanguinea]|uniref:Uncharacterized protein n=1 Tax=Trametes sanguinea TaxID=158606 RepID=A0ACC1MQS7_9APHY|nr:hypothetical protein NUW54_g12982 [Trametes sanguinea]
MTNSFPGLTRVKKRSHAEAFQRESSSSPEPSPPPPVRSQPPPSDRTSSKSRNSKKKKKKGPAKPKPSLEERSSSSEPSDEEHVAAVSEMPEHNPRVVHAYKALDPRAKLITRLGSSFEHLYQAARMLPRYIGAFVNYETVLSKGLARYGTYTDDDRDYAKFIFNEYWEVRTYFRIIIKHFPGLKDHMEYLREDADLVGQLAEFMRCIARKTRSDDAGRIRRYIYEIAGWDDQDLKIKSGRGFKNVTTGRLLCPVTLLEEFDRDPQAFCRDVRDMRDE